MRPSGFGKVIGIDKLDRKSITSPGEFSNMIKQTKQAKKDELSKLGYTPYCEPEIKKTHKK